MKVSASRPRIGLLALTLELYEQMAPELRPGRERWLREQVLPALASAAEVRFTRAVWTRDDIEQVVAEYEAAQLDALLVMHLTYSPSGHALPALKQTRLPILVWNTQELAGVDSNLAKHAMIENHGVHGTQDLCSVLVREGVPFEYATSHLADSNALAQLSDYFTAAAAVHRLRQARIGLLGYPFPGMGDLAVDMTHLAATLGCRCQPLALPEYHRRAASADTGRVEALKAEYRAAYDVANDVTETDLDATARAEVALRSMAEDHRLDALSYQFLCFGEDDRSVTVPFVAISRMMSEGMGFAGEGDVVGAAGSWLLGRLQSPASFTEIFTIDFAGNGMALSHMGEANVAMARRDRRVPLVVRPKPIVPTQAGQLALITSFEPGPATLCALTMGPGGRWRLIASTLRIEDFGPLPGMCVPHCRVIAHRDVRDWLTAYAQLGGPHHHAVCFGDARNKIRLAARLINAEYHEI
ncbi:MAG: L-fucose/L-arabinose isomerase family protein [Patescibacteria group bacterium]|nr:L-fucose/L-arabinose isomerase family protein [Patescibacteria group bacterium]